MCGWKLPSTAYFACLRCSCLSGTCFRDVARASVKRKGLRAWAGHVDEPVWMASLFIWSSATSAQDSQSVTSPLLAFLLRLPGIGSLGLATSTAVWAVLPVATPILLIGIAIGPILLVRILAICVLRHPQLVHAPRYPNLLHHVYELDGPRRQSRRRFTRSLPGVDAAAPSGVLRFGGGACPGSA